MSDTTLAIAQPQPYPRKRQHQQKQVRDAKEIQQIILQDIRNEETPPKDRASLARSWCLLSDCIRELRGIPKSGSLQPSLDPVLLAKKMQRSRNGKRAHMIDVPGMVTRIAPKDDDAFAEMPPDQPAPRTSKAGPGRDANGETETRVAEGD